MSFKAPLGAEQFCALANEGEVFFLGEKGVGSDLAV